MKIAVIGSGIAGLSAAYRLAQENHNVTLFEANDYFGGHTHTVDVTLDGQTYGVDTGFLVFNHKTYPNLVRLFEELDIDTAATDMSFSVKLPLSKGPGARVLEWAGANLGTVFAQRRNLLSPRFYRMLRDILRFNRQATALAAAQAATAPGGDGALSLGAFLQRHRYSDEFIAWYLLPMAGCIWSCPTAQMMAFPVVTIIRFFHNHGLLQVNDRPQWCTVRGGARRYVDKLLAGIPDKRLNTPVKSVTRTKLNGRPQIAIETEHDLYLYDEVVMAGHSDQSLALLTDPDNRESALLGAIRYHPNRAVLHTDASVLPVSKKAWSAWNYQSLPGKDAEVCVHYLINQLQPLPFSTPVIVSLNPVVQPDPACVIDSFDYAHPVFDQAAVDAQQLLGTIQGQRNTWFAGAWTGYGFHEDGLKSGLAVGAAIAARSGSAYPESAAA
jgi:predicted NAD/FAD-binding protein